MSRFAVDPTGTHLTRDGVPWPLVADTVWGAFADVQPQEWRDHLELRRHQGFTAIAVSALPILHDRSIWDGALNPFAAREAGTWDLDRPEQAYYDRVREYAQVATELGMALVVIAQWCTYGTDTWASKIVSWGVLDEGQRRAHVTRLLAAVEGCDVIMSVTGDDRYDGPAQAEWLDLARQLRAEAPDLVLTTHLTPEVMPAEELLEQLDFFTYQSGHDRAHPELAHTLAEPFLARSKPAPVVNLEPCYEFHGFGHVRTGRFSAHDVRTAAWASLLGGAAAGIGYGAHGVWQWHRREGRFLSSEWSMEPLPWSVAARLPGADGMGLLGRLWLEHRMWRLLPAQHLVTDDHGSLRVGASNDQSLVAVHLPAARPVEIEADLAGHRVRAWDCATGAEFTPTVEVVDQRTLISQPEVFSDCLVVFTAETT
ncbi:apiosidase-like domain-containing protein [Aestuariimicrobium ganziense]|uniref:apiosidase-like domain-containing protein n=1 Tax=Aestuariimicrobium ganziense TaxID=2773677 RepID=UPI0019452A0F|nr:DUF4038 domain-containing protein [Aestuariimicrobium ganziense]